jgi:outer membrane murein-binding lipoprotein Lpp
MRRSLLLMLVAALLGAGLLAGCGGDDDGGGDSQAEVKEKFDEDYRELNDDLLDLGEEVGQAVNGARGKSDAALATQFTGLGERTQEIKRRLDELEPPEDLEALRQRLSNAVEVVGSDLTSIGQAAENNDARGARQQAQELVRHSVEVRTARRELARKTGATVEREPG